MPSGVRDMGSNTATNLFLMIGMTNPHIDDRKQQIHSRIRELIFLLNKLESDYPRLISVGKEWTARHTYEEMTTKSILQYTLSQTNLAVKTRNEKPVQKQNSLP